MSIEAVEIVILGRPYKVSCPLGQQDAPAPGRRPADRQAHRASSTFQGLQQRTAGRRGSAHFCHEPLALKRENHHTLRPWTKRIKMLQRTIEAALIEHGQYGESSKRRNSPNRTEF